MVAHPFDLSCHLKWLLWMCLLPASKPQHSRNARLQSTCSHRVKMQPPLTCHLSSHSASPLRYSTTSIICDVSTPSVRHRDADIEVQTDGFDDTAYGVLDGVQDPTMGWGGGGLFFKTFTCVPV